MKEQPNFSYINQLSGGDKAFESKLIAIVKREFPEEVKEYQQYLYEKKYEIAADSVHKIKHKISILGLELSYQLAIDYENDLRNEDLSKKNEFDEVLNAITSFIKEIN
ncbi:Hpt domain-containing protein [Mesonia aestuariivivens]|uniref:Hpt domain-containing protein n=1 Tax=Mesonia aestuariivivens TaxID=2796128 RepID=A0ABS6W4M2_9FLAO|nr:Hpt domain-containing protein [Mesonia aestuariivivens]MBW2962821.1 Hpt domain-containing protein [Mesonia aestuariivivens]